MDFVLAHGFNVKDGGKNTIDRLKKPLIDDGHKIQEADSGYNFLGRVRLCNRNYAEIIAGMTTEGSVGIGHSNGCALLIDAARRGAGFSKLILINPALDRDTELPPEIDECLVIANRTDSVVTTSRFLLWHPWGDMGRVGYTGTDKRYTTIFSDDWGMEDHSGVFDDIPTLLEQIYKFLEI